MPCVDGLREMRCWTGQERNGRAEWEVRLESREATASLVCCADHVYRLRLNGAVLEKRTGPLYKGLRSTERAGSSCCRCPVRQACEGRQDRAQQGRRPRPSLTTPQHCLEKPCHFWVGFRLDSYSRRCAKGQFERCAAAPGATDTMDAESGCIHAAVSVTECNDYEDRSGAEVQVVAEEQRARLRRIRPRWFSADIRLRGASGLSGPMREHTSPALSS